LRISILRRGGALLAAGAAVLSLCSGCAGEGVAVTTAADSGIPVETASWGLAFPAEGQTPVGSAAAAELARYNAWYVGDTTRKVIYLTFDCGYENGCTGQILDALDKHHAPAAFFVVGHMLNSAPELIRRMADSGYLVGNHTFHHPDMSAISDEADFRRELDDTAALYRKITGKEMPRYYRPPRGEYSEENLRQAAELGYRTIFWSLAYVDWNTDDQPTPEEAYAKLLPRIHNGAIVLLHQTSRTNAQILDELLTRWEEMGYTFASLEELPDAQAES